MMERKSGANAAAILRTAFVAILVILQFTFAAIISFKMEEYSVPLYLLLNVAALLVVLYLLNDSRDASYKMAWVLIVMLLPIFGLILYMMWGRGMSSSRDRRYRNRAFQRGYEQTPSLPENITALEKSNPGRSRISSYLESFHFPVYRNTKTEYYPLGEDFFDALIADMEKAKKFIFLEYFIIEPGQVWGRIYDVMRRKAKEGVQVRLMYDDAGCLFTLHKTFRRQLEDDGVLVAVFAPVHRYISELYLNYRNHQKIAVIDGDISYVGGNNLADEYANLYNKHGHWKDTAMRMEGEATWGNTVTFLTMWDLTQRGSLTEDYEPYRPHTTVKSDGYYQPFSDNPSNNPQNPAEDLYCQLLRTSRKYCYLTTPYLVIDDVMNDSLRVAAQSGVDVRIITPKIPDHWYVHMVTRSYYGALMREGVRIYEYAPGFMHAKMLVTDDEAAVIGSVNMDYRSFYLHYENGVYFLNDPTVCRIKEDISSVLNECEEILLEDWERRSVFIKMAEVILRLFAPLL